jgi:hypothetical protein
MVRPPRERRANERRLSVDRRRGVGMFSDRRVRAVPCELQRRVGAERRRRLDRRTADRRERSRRGAFPPFTG